LTLISKNNTLIRETSTIINRFCFSQSIFLDSPHNPSYNQLFMKQTLFTSKLLKRVLSVFSLILFSQIALSQNPTVISDSLIVQQRVYAKERLVVDKLAIFKEDVRIDGSTRIKTDLRVDSVLRVDGTARLNGNVRMNNLGTISAVNDSTQILVIMPNGQLKKGGIGMLVDMIYELAVCAPDGMNINPTWSNGLNKIFSICPDVKVGIGTDDPNHLLDVRGRIYGKNLLVGNLNANVDALINGYAENTSQYLLNLGVKVGALTEEIRFRITNTGTVILRNGGGHSLIAYNNVGDKILQLQNSGRLRAREILVDETSWPDYVFDKNYKLPKLNEVAKYIEKNHHLPGVPSAKEIESGGLNLGDMQKIQMQKIEELTLYLIEMDEKMTSMEKRMNELEKENLELKKNNK